MNKPEVTRKCLEVGLAVTSSGNPAEINSTCLGEFFDAGAYVACETLDVVCYELAGVEFVVLDERR